MVNFSFLLTREFFSGKILALETIHDTNLISSICFFQSRSGSIHKKRKIWEHKCCYSIKFFILFCAENCCWLGAVVCKQNKLQNSRTFQAVEKCVSQCRSLANNFTKSCSNFMKCCKYQQ